MLGKIIKHEFKGTWKFFTIAFSVFTLTVIGLRLTMSAFVSQNSQPGLIDTILLLIMFFTVIIVSALFVFSPTLMNVIRFYKTTVTTRGYLTHTLPVSTDKLIIGKLIVASLWQLLVVLYSVGAFVALVLSFNILDPYLLGTTLTDAISFTLSTNPKAFAAIIIIIASSFISMISAVLKYYCAMSIGQYFQRNKVLISIGIYIGFSIIYSIVSSVMGISTTYNLTFTSYTPQMAEIIIKMFELFFLPAIKLVVLDIAFASVYYILTRHFLKNKLNLS